MYARIMAPYDVRQLSRALRPATPRVAGGANARAATASGKGAVPSQSRDAAVAAALGARGAVAATVAFGSKRSGCAIK